MTEGCGDDRGDAQDDKGDTQGDSQAALKPCTSLLSSPKIMESAYALTDKGLSMVLAPATRPESYFELVYRSFNLYKNSLKRTFWLALVFSLIIFIPRLIAIQLGFAMNLLDFSRFNPYQWLFILIYLLSIWLFAAIYWRMRCVALNKHETFIDDLKKGAKKVFYLLGAALLVLALAYLLAAFILLCRQLALYFGLLNRADLLSDLIFCAVLLAPVIMAFYVTMLFVFYFPLIVIENDRIFFALKQSASLVVGHVWRTFSLQMTPWICYFITILVIKLFFQLSFHLYFFPLDEIPSYPAVGLQLLLLALFIPWSVAAMIVQLRDLELRKETVA